MGAKISTKIKRLENVRLDPAAALAKAIKEDPLVCTDLEILKDRMKRNRFGEMKLILGTETVWKRNKIINQDGVIDNPAMAEAIRNIQCMPRIQIWQPKE